MGSNVGLGALISLERNAWITFGSRTPHCSIALATWLMSQEQPTKTQSTNLSVAAEYPRCAHCPRAPIATCLTSEEGSFRHSANSTTGAGSHLPRNFAASVRTESLGFLSARIRR